VISVTLVRDDAHTVAVLDSSRRLPQRRRRARRPGFTTPLAASSGTPTTGVGNPNVQRAEFRATC